MIREPLRHCKHYRAMLLTSASVLAVALVASGQTGPGAQDKNAKAPLPAFEVVSIKPYKPDGASGMRLGVSMTPDGVSIEGIPLRMLVRQAFGVSEDRVVNEPGWAESGRYDIEAKVDAGDEPALRKLNAQQRWAMILPVLEDRFGLKFHHETRNLEVYELVVAKGGLKMKEAAPAEPDAKPAPRASIRTWAKGLSFECHGLSTSSLANMLSQQLGSTVADNTGLKGTYDFTLDWTPDLGQGQIMGGLETGPPPSGSPPPAEENGPSLFTALQEQLGLKLEVHKESIDVIVIDHIEQPSPN